MYVVVVTITAAVVVFDLVFDAVVIVHIDSVAVALLYPLSLL
jgi:hypothetical protein